jgi:predicted ArsR family transcriptional regulator
MEGARPGRSPTFFNEKRLTMDYAEAKAKVVEGLTKKLKTKSKFYFNDLADILEMKPREAKKLINDMVTDGTLEYWSSGSTSMYGLTGTGKQAAAEHEE